VQKADQFYLLFLWWDEAGEKIKVFKHKRVVFGVKSSPFILGAVIDYHLDTVIDEDMVVTQKLRRSFYVDNCVTSVNSMEEYLDFKSRATKIMSGAKMELRQWEHSTSSGIGLNQGVGLDDVSYEQEDDNFARFTLPQTSFEDNPDITSVLGMKWHKRRDTLSVSTFPMMPSNLTKRS